MQSNKDFAILNAGRIVEASLIYGTKYTGRIIGYRDGELQAILIEDKNKKLVKKEELNKGIHLVVDGNVHHGNFVDRSNITMINNSSNNNDLSLNNVISYLSTLIDIENKNNDIINKYNIAINENNQLKSEIKNLNSTIKELENYKIELDKIKKELMPSYNSLDKPRFSCIEIDAGEIN